jgi:hypothetical protein
MRSKKFKFRNPHSAIPACRQARRMEKRGYPVIPAQAGIQNKANSWIPASAGMTRCGKFLIILVSTQFFFWDFGSVRLRKNARD